jgi:hypothetical protein
MNPACADSGYGYLSQDRTSFGVTVAGHQKRVTTTATWESPGCSPKSYPCDLPGSGGTIPHAKRLRASWAILWGADSV